MRHSPCSRANLKNTLQQATNEALGKRKKRRNKRRLILWNEDIKKLIENKMYLRYLATRFETDKMEYKRVVATVKRETRLNTKYITSSQNTTKFIALCCTIRYTTTCFGPFLRPSSGCICLALRVMYPDDNVYYLVDEISIIL